VSIIEELLKIGLELHDERRLSKQELDALSSGKPVPMARTEDEMRQDLGLALSKPSLNSEMRARAEERCGELMVERQKVKKSLEERGEKEWLEGIDRLSVASVDLLTVTVYYPALGGG
jgi:hypothetical protein